MATPSAVSQQLRIMLAAPQMLATLEMVLPLIRKEAAECAAASIFTSEPTLIRESADAWFEAVAHIERAIQKARIAPGPRRLQIVKEPVRNNPRKAHQAGGKHVAN